MNRSFIIPARLHPAYSLLGRWIRRRSPDSRAAETIWILAATMLATGLIVSQVLTWAYLQPMSASTLQAFVAVEIALAVVFAAVAVLGRQPARRVLLDDQGIRIEGPRERLFAAYSDIRQVSIIDADVYYTHYSRYARTRAFVNRIPSSLLLIELDRRPVIIGLEPDDLLEVERILADRAEASFATPRVGVV